MSETSPRSRRGRPRLAKGKGAMPTLVFRPEVDVRESVERAATKTGNTLSAEINSGLRRVHWREEDYASAQARLFGSDHGLALSFLLARITTGIEHEMRATVQDSEAVRAQVEEAWRFLLGAAMARWRGRMTNSCYAPMVERDGAAAVQLEFDEPTEEPPPWLRVITAIHQNLTEGNGRYWWPLGADPAGSKPSIKEPPLRPSFEALREVWPVGAVAA